MSPKQQPSKQQRQAQNQRQRAARQARTEAAAVGESSRTAETGAVAPATGGGGSLLSRLRGGSGGSSAPAGAARSGPSGGATTARPAAGGMPPGQRAAISALFAAVAAALVGSIMFPVPIGRDGEPITDREGVVAEWSITALDAVQANPDLTAEQAIDEVDDWAPGGTQPYAQAFFPLSLGVLLPVIGTALGVRAVRKRAPAKTVNRTVYITLFGTLLNAQLLLVFLPAVISLGVAAFQVRKAEVAAGGPLGPSAVDDQPDTATTPATDDQVIDVDEAEVEVDGAEDEADNPR